MSMNLNANFFSIFDENNAFVSDIHSSIFLRNILYFIWIKFYIRLKFCF